MEYTNAILFENEDFTFEVLTSKDKQESKELIALSFLDEPITRAISDRILNVDKQDLEIFIDFFLEEVCTNKLSVVAREKASNKLIGVCYNMDYNFLDDTVYNYYSDPSKPLHYLVNFLHSAGEQVKRIIPELENKNTVIDIWLLGLHPDFRGKKISPILVQLSIALIKNSGYKYACVEATSFFTKKIIEANDFECLYKLDVKNWSYNNKFVLEGISNLHKEFTFWVKKFK